MILIAVLYAVLALTFIFAKNALFYAKPFFLIAVRMLISGSLLLCYQWLWRRRHFVVRREDIALFIKVALFHIYFAFTLEFFALQYLSSLKTTMIYSSTPFISAILAHFLLRERLSAKKVIGIAVGVLGLVPILMAQAEAGLSGKELFSVSLPEGVLMIAVISAAYAWFMVMELMNKGYELVMINGVAMAVGGLMSMGTSFALEGFGFHVTQAGPFIGWLVLLIFTANIVVYNLYGFLLRRHSIVLISFAGWLCPSFAALYEWLFLSGSITWHYGLSLMLVIIGLYFFYREDLVARR